MYTSTLNYQGIKEQFVALTIELEDRIKVCDLLTSRIERERVSIAEVATITSEEFKLKKEDESAQQRNREEDLLLETGQLMETKRKILEECKVIVSQIKLLEEETCILMKQKLDSASNLIEQQRKLYRSGQDERLQKAMSSRMSEYRDALMRMMGPEVDRLQQQNTTELSNILSKAAVEERKIRNEMQSKLVSLIFDESSKLKRDLQRQIRSLVDSSVEEYEKLEREHKSCVIDLTDKLERELHSLRLTHKTKLDKDRKSYEDDLKKIEDEFQSRLCEIKAKHSKDVSVLQKEHESQLKQLRSVWKQKKEKVEAELGIKSNIDDKDISDKEEENFLTINDDSTRKITAEFRKIAIADRDKLIHSEIRQHQLESIRLERSWLAAAEIERSKILQIQDKERLEYLKKKDHLSDVIAEFSTEKEFLLKEEEKLLNNLKHLNLDVTEYTKNIEIYESGIMAHRLRLKDAENVNQMKRDEAKKEFNLQLRVCENEITAAHRLGEKKKNGFNR